MLPNRVFGPKRCALFWKVCQKKIDFFFRFIKFPFAVYGTIFRQKCWQKIELCSDFVQTQICIRFRTFWENLKKLLDFSIFSSKHLKQIQKRFQTKPNKKKNFCPDFDYNFFLHRFDMILREKNVVEKKIVGIFFPDW